jgi:hypothetical protein
LKLRLFYTARGVLRSVRASRKRRRDARASVV